MKKTIINLTISLFIIFSHSSTFSQLMEVDGTMKVGTMDLDTISADIVALRADNTLALMDTSSLENPWHVGQAALGGIVFYTYTGDDGLQHGLIVSIIEATTQWQSQPNSTGGNRSWDGKFNTEHMFNSPAKDWVKDNFTTAWYLPSIDELALLWHNRLNVNKVLHQGGHTLLGPTGAYWSSTETGGALAMFFGFGDGDSEDTGKTNSFKVRAIRPF